MANMYDLANELGREIRNLPEYKAVEVAKIAIQSDAEAKQIFSDYLVFQGELQNLAQTGQMPDANFQEKMREFSEKIQGNALLSEFFNKQQYLSIYLSDIEKIIFEPVQDLLK
ncbi:hypothetical protein STRDD10_00038 [Streptococcus sp. DD10]|uniref:YlbF/YmcA family competence regulator n=1 Tax=Streptococcus sp. DD10 TaxID=1777878 RepID=UPI000791C3C9|nr:YlbF/YmcA family competence regulator [Streptococcus sp. DD10]KXT77302.1 hypothetical protein STRDD10_00038 [Streptococcus sp. DD10]